MLKAILEEIIGGRNTLELSTSEARKIVSEFYFRVASLTLGQRRPYSLEQKCKAVLRLHNLEYFA